MPDYRPDLSNTIPMVLLIPISEMILGTLKKSFPTVVEALEEDENLFFGSFKTYGGTERDVNGIYSIEDTASVETWFRPDIQSNCRIALANSGAIYEIINEPENINQRSQFLGFKVKRIKGGA
jgi:hypothetical protein